MFYYDPQLRACLPFIYSGCGGNNNRFSSRTECLSVCGEEDFEDLTPDWDVEELEESAVTNNFPKSSEGTKIQEGRDSAETRPGYT
ncbi:hypothetical protein TNCV_2155161 [Trichonephila clavipes]|nr:hypothetical protein TNCV_2155161 [Trichonephila clavipes]